MRATPLLARPLPPPACCLSFRRHAPAAGLENRVRYRVAGEGVSWGLQSVIHLQAAQTSCQRPWRPSRPGFCTEHNQLRHHGLPAASEKGCRPPGRETELARVVPRGLWSDAPLHAQDAPIKLAIVMKVIGRTGSRGQARFGCV